MAREITYNNFEISLMVFMPNVTTNHAVFNSSALTVGPRYFLLISGPLKRRGGTPRPRQPVATGYG